MQVREGCSICEIRCDKFAQIRQGKGIKSGIPLAFNFHIRVVGIILKNINCQLILAFAAVVFV